MPDQDPAPPTGLTTLDDVRATVRAELLIAVEELAATEDYEALEVFVARADYIGRLTGAYVTLGGDLELARRSDDLVAAARRLAVATSELTAEDFPERIRGIVPAINAVVLEATR